MEPPDLSGPGLSIMHVNSQSLLPKMGEFELLMETVQPDIACLTETWLSDAIPDGIINCPGYTAHRLDRRSGRRGGGVACYFQNKLFEDGLIDEHHELWVSNTHIELQIFELKVRNIKKTILLNVYRPPSGKSDLFIDGLSDVLSFFPKLQEYDIFYAGRFQFAL